MPPRARNPLPVQRTQSHAPAREWVGGRVVTPITVAADEPYQPEMMIWMEVPDRIVVAFHLVDPDAPTVPFGDTLEAAMRKPMVGRPRRPGRVRVADEALVAEVRRVLPEASVVVAPTPELDHLVEAMGPGTADASDVGSEDLDWLVFLARGSCDPEALGSFFRASGLLHRFAPWKTVNDDFVVRVDIPEYGVRGACLSVIGEFGEEMGLLLFPSLEAFEAFVDAGEARRQPIDLGTDFLSLSYEPVSGLPGTLRRLIKDRKFLEKGETDFPVLVPVNRHGRPDPVSERDVRVMTACVLGFVSCFVKHREIFKDQRDDRPICESYFDEDDVETRLTVPYEAWPAFEVNEPPRGRKAATPPAVRAPAVGRNAPCPCGSGKKYKKCCEGRDAAAVREAPPEGSSAPGAALNPIQKLEGRLLDTINRFAGLRFGNRWMTRIDDLFEDPEEARELAIAWMFYHEPYEGKSVARWYLDEGPSRPTPAERAWLEAHAASWVSVWEVGDTVPGVRLTLVDQLSGESREVLDTSLSKTVVRRDTVLASVIEFEGRTILGGLHPRALRPGDAATAVEEVQRRLRRKSLAPIERLRDPGIGRAMILAWEAAVGDFDERRRRPPDLRNTDGHVLRFTTDSFSFAASRRTGIVQVLSAEPDLHRDESSGPGGDAVFVINRAVNQKLHGMESTVIGQVVVAARKLSIETNSVERADALRERFTRLLGPPLKFVERAHEELPPWPPVAPPAGNAPPELLNLPELADISRTMKAKHYADWVDHPLPALGGKTPRAAVRTKDGRREVDLLLRDMENMEARSPEAERYDFSGIRRDLGLER